MSRWSRLLPRRREAKLLHIPKTGGTYIAQHESKRGAVVRPMRSIGHVFIVDPASPPPAPFPPLGFQRGCTMPRHRLEASPVLACVRNPFAWLVSYAGHAGGWNPRYRDPDHYDFELASRGFDYLVKSIAEREDYWPSRKLLFMQLFDTAGRLVPSFVARNETLAEDLPAFARRHRLAYRPGPKQRDGKHADYRTYYDDALVERVEATWGRELRLFGYAFDGFADDAPLMPRVIDADARGRFLYDHPRDRLTVAGRELTERRSAAAVARAA